MSLGVRGWGCSCETGGGGDVPLSGLHADTVPVRKPLSQGRDLGSEPWAVEWERSVAAPDPSSPEHTPMTHALPGVTPDATETPLRWPCSPGPAQGCPEPPRGRRGLQRAQGPGLPGQGGRAQLARSPQVPTQHHGVSSRRVTGPPASSPQRLGDRAGPGPGPPPRPPQPPRLPHGLTAFPRTDPRTPQPRVLLPLLPARQGEVLSAGKADPCTLRPG